MESGYAGGRAAGCESRLRPSGWRAVGTASSGIFDCAKSPEVAGSTRESCQHDCFFVETLVVDPATHALTSFALARGIFRRRPWWFVLGVVLAGTMADFVLGLAFLGAGCVLAASHY